MVWCCIGGCRRIGIRLRILRCEGEKEGGVMRYEGLVLFWVFICIFGLYFWLYRSWILGLGLFLHGIAWGACWRGKRRGGDVGI